MGWFKKLTKFYDPKTYGIGDKKTGKEVWDLENLNELGFHGPTGHIGFGSPLWAYNQYTQDPNVKALSERAEDDFNKDYRGQYMQQANVGIDNQLASIGQALAGRGGGGFGSAIGMGAQARSGALLGALGQAEAARIGAQGRLSDVTTERFNVLNQIMSGTLGNTQANLAYKGQKAAASASGLAGVYGMLGGIFGGDLFSKDKGD